MIRLLFFSRDYTGEMVSGAEDPRGKCHSHPTRLITVDVDLDHPAEGGLVSFRHCKMTLFSSSPCCVLLGKTIPRAAHS